MSRCLKKVINNKTNYLFLLTLFIWVMGTSYHRLFVAADMRLVFEALTLPEKLARWWTPDVTQNGTTLRFGFQENYAKEMLVTETHDFDLVRWKCTDATAEWIGTEIIFELVSGPTGSLLQSHPELAEQIAQSETSNGTILIFRHQNWQSESPMFAECNYTWAMFLRSLKLFCEVGGGKPWAEQHG